MATRSRDPTAPDWLVATATQEDTVLHHPVLQPSQILHHDVNEAGDEAGEDADHGTDDPALDLHRAERLRDRQPSEPTGGTPAHLTTLASTALSPGSSEETYPRKTNVGCPRIAKLGHN